MTDKTSMYAPSWLKKLVRPFRKQAVMALVLGVASACCSALLMFFAGYLICRTAFPETTLFMVMIPIALVQLFGFGRPLTHYFERLVSHDWVFRITSGLRKALFQAALKITGDPANPKSSGDYLEMLADDIGHLQNLYLRVAFPTVIAFVMFVCACVFSSVFDILLGVAMLVVGIIATLVIPSIAYAVTKSAQLYAKDLKSQSYGQISDDVMGALDWSLAGRSRDAVDLNERAGSALASAESRIRRRIRVFELVSALFLGLGVVAITYLAALAFQGYTPTSHFIAAFALGLFPLMQMFILLPGAVSDAPTHLSSIGHLDDVLSYGAISSEAVPPEAPSRVSHSVELSDVSYRYPTADKTSLTHIDLFVLQGQKVAIIGQSGSGKTTLAAIMRGALNPLEGDVTVGGLCMPHAATCVCYIPQTPYLFDATLRENLAIANPQASDAEMLEALANVGLEDEVSSLSSGLDTHIGETGIGFSGGEAHRIAIARGLLSQRHVVLLDEPFSAVDPATERLLLDTLFSVFADKTLIVITHHLMDIERFDRVVLMHDGAIELDGSPDYLAETSTHFRELLGFDRGMRIRQHDDG